MIGKDLWDGEDSECLETLSCNLVLIVNSSHMLSIHHFTKITPEASANNDVTIC